MANQHHHHPNEPRDWPTYALCEADFQWNPPEEPASPSDSGQLF